MQPKQNYTEREPDNQGAGKKIVAQLSSFLHVFSFSTQGDYKLCGTGILLFFFLLLQGVSKSNKPSGTQNRHSSHRVRDHHENAKGTICAEYTLMEA